VGGGRSVERVGRVRSDRAVAELPHGGIQLVAVADGDRHASTFGRYQAVARPMPLLPSD
jgi:hypothetical protein